MPNVWSQPDSDQFWAKREWRLTGQDNNILSRKAQYVLDKQNRLDKIQNDKASFLEVNSMKQQSENSPRFIPSHDIENLKFWMEHGLYTYSNKCKAILPLRLLPKFTKCPLVKEGSKSCPCKTKRYLQPNAVDIPNVLCGLSHGEICALRPLEIHNGHYVHAENGYRKKDAIFQLSWSSKSVIEKINDISNERSRQRCFDAYEYLMRESRSSYKKFVDMTK